MYQYYPQHKNRIAMIIAFVATILPFTAIYFSAVFKIPYASVIQFASVVIFTEAIIIISKFILRKLLYKIEFLEARNQYMKSGYVFEVLEVKSKKSVPLCRIGLENLTDFVIESKENRKEIRARVKSKGKSRRFYNYCIDLNPKDAAWLFFDDTYEGEKGEIVIKFSPDEKMTGILNEFKKKTYQKSGSNDNSEEKDENQA